MTILTDPLRRRAWSLWTLACAAVVCLIAQPTAAQSGPQPVGLTLDEAIEIALIRNYMVRTVRLDVDEASALVKEGWGQVFPQVSFNTSYTRNLKTANPFAGSQAGGLFQSLGFLDWLAFNERAQIGRAHV